MQKYIKRFAVLIVLIISSPIVLLGFVYKEVKDYFKFGIELSEYAGRKFTDWVGKND
jgi:hypothetical protein